MYICIEGNIGSGKSTLAKALVTKLKANYLPEQFEDNTLLPLFYENRKKYAFLLEYSFLIERQKQLSTYFKQLQNNKITVSDFHFDKCLCYANVNLTPTDFVFFSKHFKTIQNTLPKPDLVIFLDVRPELLLVNIKKRGREFEKDFDVNYLKKFKKALDVNYIKTAKKSTLTIPIKTYTNSTIEELCHLICNHIKL